MAPFSSKADEVTLPPARVLIAVLFACLALGGCANVLPKQGWGSTAHWPDRDDLSRAFLTAAKDPQTWVPAAGALLLQVGDADENASEWFAREQPFFGRNASSTSDTLSDLTTGMYFATALISSSASARDKGKGLAVGLGAFAVNSAVTRGLKSSVGRRRPNGRDDRSMPSGHASNASVSATLAISNLDYMPAPAWVNKSLKVGLYAMAGGAGLARVEAGEHYLSDVLAGYSIGHFVAAFMQQAFLEAGPSQVSASFMPVQGGGGVVIFSVPVGQK